MDFRSLRPALAALALAAAPVIAAAAPLQAGAIAAPERNAARAAAEILKAGGNAVDAAVAEGFALAVTFPEAGNIGGGGFMTLWVKGKPYFLDYREAAPAAAGADMYLDAKGDIVPNLSLIGNKAAGVPGTVRGFWEAHRRFGKLPWARDLAPAIRLASQGFDISKSEIDTREGDRAQFAGITNFDRYYGGMAIGRVFRQPELAATLTRIARGGDRAFYEGPTAHLIVAQMGRGRTKGLITLADLAGYRAPWRAPDRRDVARLYGDHRPAAQLRRRRPPAAAGDEAGRRAALPWRRPQLAAVHSPGLGNREARLRRSRRVPRRS